MHYRHLGWSTSAAWLVYLFVALRRIYGDGTIRRRAALARRWSLLFLPILLAYRLLLFFVTLKTMH